MATENQKLTPAELMAERAEQDRPYLEKQREEFESLCHFDRHLNRAKLGLTPRAEVLTN